MALPNKTPAIEWRPRHGRGGALTEEQAAAQKAQAERKAAIHRSAMRMRDAGTMPRREPCHDCGGKSPDIELCPTCWSVGTLLVG